MRASARPVAAAVVLALAPLVACGSNGRFAVPGASTTTSTAGVAATAPSSSTSTTAALAQLTWRARASAPSARQEVAAAVVEGRVWVVGGLTAAGATAKVESYDPVTDRWAAGPDLPVAVHHHAAVAFRGELVVVGGFLGGGSDLYSRPTDRVFALRGGAWVELPRLRRPRGAAAAAVVGNTVVVVGGRDSGLLVGPTEVFDGTAWQDRAPIPTLRDHVAADSDGRALYAVGGRFLSPGRTSDAVERYDPARDAWEPIAPLPTARGGLGVAFVGGRLVAAGGEDAVKVYPQVEAFDVATGTWSSLASMPTPRHGLALTTVGTAVLALVGGDEAGVAPSAAAEALAP